MPPNTLDIRCNTPPFSGFSARDLEALPQLPHDAITNRRGRLPWGMSEANTPSAGAAAAGPLLGVQANHVLDEPAVFDAVGENDVRPVAPSGKDSIPLRVADPQFGLPCRQITGVMLPEHTRCRSNEAPESLEEHLSRGVGGGVGELTHEQAFADECPKRRRDPQRVRLQLRVGRSKLSRRAGRDLRATKLVNLRTDEVDLEGRRISFMGKGRKFRAVPIPHPLAPALREYMDEVRPRLPASPCLFANPAGLAIESSTGASALAQCTTSWIRPEPAQELPGGTVPTAGATRTPRALSARASTSASSSG